MIRMVYYLISNDPDTLTGMRMAGIRGVSVSTQEEADAAIDRAVADPQVGILIVTRAIAALCAEKLAPLKADGRTPLVVEIPTREDAGQPSDSITRYIREAIGVKI